MNHPEEVLKAHLDSETIAAYLDGVLTPDEVVAVEGHLADCSECRSDVTEAVRLLRAPARRRRWLVMGPLAAAAAVAIFIFAPSSQQMTEQAGETVRSGESTGDEAVPRITPLAPLPGVTVGPERIVFAWEIVDGSSTYRITLTDERGDVVWTDDTSDTRISLPPAIELMPDQVYFWYVDALMPDASSATTGVQEFRTPP